MDCRLAMNGIQRIGSLLQRVFFGYAMTLVMKGVLKRVLNLARKAARFKDQIPEFYLNIFGGIYGY